MTLRIRPVPQPSASANTHHPSAPLAEGKVYSYQLSPAPLFAVFLLRPCFYALQLCLFRLFWYIQIHGDGRQVALHVSNGARLISGKLWGFVPGAPAAGERVPWKVETPRQCQNGKLFAKIM